MGITIILGSGVLFGVFFVCLMFCLHLVKVYNALPPYIALLPSFVLLLKSSFSLMY